MTPLALARPALTARAEVCAAVLTLLLLVLLIPTGGPAI